MTIHVLCVHHPHCYSAGIELGLYVQGCTKHQDVASVGDVKPLSLRRSTMPNNWILVLAFGRVGVETQAGIR